MDTIYYFTVLIIVILNIFSFLFYGIDKLKAIKNKWRISEKALILVSFIAPYGSLLAMALFRHKTKKLKFNILVPLFLIIHISASIFLIKYFSIFT